MALPAAIIVAIIMVAGILSYLSHIGWGPRLQAAWNIIRAHASNLTDEAGRIYHDTLLPAMRRTKVATVSMIGALGVLACLTDMTPVCKAVAVVVSFGVMLAVLLVEREGRSHRGNATIAVGDDFHDIAYPAFARRPVIRITPFDPSTDFAVGNVVPDGFRIQLPAAATAPAAFAWRVLERPEGWPGLSIISTAFIAFAVQAAALLALGLTSGSRQAVLLSLVAMAAAVAVFFTLARFFVWVAEKGIGLVEFVPNAFLEITFAAIRRKWDKIEEVMSRITDSSRQAVNIANQEEFKKQWKFQLRRVIAVLASTYGIAFLAPAWKWVLLWTGIQVAGLLVVYLHEYRETQFAELVAKGEAERAADLQKIRRRLANLRLASLTGYVVIIATLLVGVVAMAFSATAAAKIDLLVADAGRLFDTAFDGTHYGASWLIEAGSGRYVGAFVAMLAMLVAAALVYGDGVSRARKLAAYALGTVAFVAGGAFVISATASAAPKVASETLGPSTLGPIAPKLELTTTQSVKTPSVKMPSVKVKWSNVPGATGYVIQRRELTEPKFTDIGTLPIGITHWEDTSVRKGTTYYYRAVVKIAANVPLTSPEREIAIPKEPEPDAAPAISVAPEAPTAAASTAPPAPATPPASGAADAGGMSEDLSELCRRYPGAC